MSEKRPFDAFDTWWTEHYSMANLAYGAAQDAWDAAIQAERERCAKAITERKAIYQAKWDAADCFAEDQHTRWDLFKHTVEAFEYLEADLAIRTPSTGEEQ